MRCRDVEKHHRHKVRTLIDLLQDLRAACSEFVSEHGLGLRTRVECRYPLRLGRTQFCGNFDKVLGSRLEPSAEVQVRSQHFFGFGPLKGAFQVEGLALHENTGAGVTVLVIRGDSTNVGQKQNVGILGQKIVHEPMRKSRRENKRQRPADPLLWGRDDRAARSGTPIP